MPEEIVRSAFEFIAPTLLSYFPPLPNPQSKISKARWGKNPSLAKGDNYKMCGGLRNTIGQSSQI